MLLDYDEDIIILKELGLTLSQAKVYAAAAKLGKAKAKDLREESGVGRQELYRILNELSEIGLIEKQISIPTQFRSMPVSKGALMLFNRKRNEVVMLSEKIKKITSKNRKICIDEDQGSEFLVLPRKHLMDNRGEYSYKNAKKTIEFFCPFKRLAGSFAYNSAVYSNPAKRGVEMRGITEKVDVAQYEKLKKEAANIFSRQNFSLRFAIPLDNFAFSLIDNKEAYFPLNLDKSLFEDHTLWTNNKSLILLAHKYFCTIWESAFEDLR